MKPVEAPKDRLLSIDELDRDIVNLSFRINAATCELLVLIRQFDERAGWLQWGLSNCAEWLHWRCDLSMSAAREKVRVAHALKTLPAIAMAFSSGELSYSKVRALTRVARVDNEENLLAFALKSTASRVEERCRELRCGTAESVGEANRAYANRSLRVFRDAERGTMTITVELPIESVKRLCCDGDAIVLVEDEDGEPLSVGRKTRTVPTAIKRVLQARDKACVFPGCHHKRFVDAHHIKHWSAGGDTSLDNLMLLCSQHHRLVHEGGFRIERDYQNRWFFQRPDGRAVPNCGYRAKDRIDDGIGDVGDKENVNKNNKFSRVINNPSAEGFLSAVKTMPDSLPLL